MIVGKLSRVGKDAVDADVLVKYEGTSISRAPRDAAFCKSCISSVIVFIVIDTIFSSWEYGEV